MRIIVDESVDFHFVKLLRSLLFSVVSIAEDFSSMADENIISMSLSPPSLIITEDKDFGDLVFYKQFKVHAVILLRYDKAEKLFIEEKLTHLLINHPNHLDNSFIVITFNKIRIRKLSFK